MKTIGIQEHTLPRPQGLIECSTVLDIGAGIRPMQWYKLRRHVCVDPHRPYCDVLKMGRTSGAPGGFRYEVWCATGEEALKGLILARGIQTCYHPDSLEAEAVGAIYLLDVLEHMEKEDGIRVLDLACKVAQQQVVVYTPFGFVEQTADVWELGGDCWQTHRSGWLPKEFSGWQTELFIPANKEEPEGFYALWIP